jgi:hypothetical protein
MDGQSVEKPITDDLVEKLAARAEAGFDPEEILSSGSRRTDSTDAADDEALRQRAEHEGRTNSELIRDALRRYM